MHYNPIHLPKRLLALALVASVYTAQAKVYHLTLEQSIDVAMEKSYTMLTLKENQKIAEYSLKAATARLRTHIDLSLTLPQYNRNIRTWENESGDVSFYAMERLDYRGSIVVNQPLITNGNIFWETGINNFENFDNNKRSSALHSRIRIRQPLDALYGYNAIRESMKAAKLDYERSNKSLKREQLGLVYQVSSKYYNLLQLQRSTEIAKLDYERQKEANTIAQNKYASGLIREVDALQMEVDLAQAQNSYEMALYSESSAVNSFKQLLGLELTDSVVLNDELKYKVVVIDPEVAVEYALKNRSELRDKEIAIEQQRAHIKQQKANGMIKGNIEGYVEKAGANVMDRDTPFGQTIAGSANDFVHRPIDFGVGLTISVPILDWGENRARVRTAEARQRQNLYSKEELERSIATDTRNAVAELNNNLKRLQLLEKSMVIAEKSFNITLQRYSDGDIDSQTLSLERNRLNGAYRSHLSAYIAYQLSLADIMRKTLYDFENNVPLSE